MVSATVPDNFSNDTDVVDDHPEPLHGFGDIFGDGPRPKLRDEDVGETTPNMCVGIGRMNPTMISCADLAS
jgi:hypothetical protein